MKNLSRNKKCAVIWYICALLDYINAVICLLNSNTSIGIMWFCIGSASLCIGSVFINKSNNDKTDNTDSDRSEDK